MKKKSASILKKFLLFNLLVFSILGLFTIIYLNAIQPNLVKQRIANHIIIINNTKDHLNRLNVKFNNQSIQKFLLSTRFLFQGLDRVQFYSLEGDLIGDTNTLDLDKSVFSKSEFIIEEKIGEAGNQNLVKDGKKEKILDIDDKSFFGKDIFMKYQDKPIVLENKIKNNFFVSTLEKVQLNSDYSGYIIVTEQANDILIAVEERRNFIIRTVLAVGLVILIFSLFLNKYILRPIKFLVLYTEAIKEKADTSIDVSKFFVREDEIGKLTKSIENMTSELQKRTNRAETFSTDLAHEIRNPLASLKGASELIDKTKDLKEREKLLNIISHDVERIERLITDYSQVLKDEASLSREKMEKVDLISIINNVVEEFKYNLTNQNKDIEIKIKSIKVNGKGLYVLGIANRLEQVIANLLDNAISFSTDKSTIDIEIKEKKDNYLIIVLDQGPGFKEKSVQKIFKRFYSNRPKSFGEHSGLGLNIVKNIVELHNGVISASNRTNMNGAMIEVSLPKYI
tara:strand:+ start:12544 stop:14076 length:1533 start_codon:yes stop_codon:yes gene_type:complete